MTNTNTAQCPKDLETKLSLEMIREIGDEGRNSRVYIMRDKQLNADLVVKRVPHDQFNNQDDYFKEAKMLYYAQHPNIMEVQHSTSDNYYIYLSMPYYKNGSLNSLINRRYLTAKEIIKYSLDFLTGLHYIHAKGLVHFDIKPTNILLNNSNRAVLTDFGLSKYIDNHGLAQQGIMYTAHRPPESLLSPILTIQADIYQAGITLYRLCNGNRIYQEQLIPYRNKQRDIRKDIANEKFPDRNFFLPHIPKRLIKVIKKSLKANPDERYKTVLDMINDISAIEISSHWVYNVNNKTNFSWKKDNEAGTHIDKIELTTRENSWDISVTKIRKSDDNVMNMNKLSSVGHNTIAKAFKEIRKIMKKY